MPDGQKITRETKTLFLVVCRSRTGSNLLLDCLKQHPNIFVRGELFKNQAINAEEQIKHWLKRPEKALGCKLFYYHATKRQEYVWDFLNENPKIQLIHLTRKDKARTVVSQIIASKTKIWKQKFSWKLPLFFRRIHLDPKLLTSEIQKTINWENDFRMRFNHRHILEISYENFTSKPQETLDNIFDFLGLERKRIQLRLKKQNPENIRRLVKNWNELEHLLKNSFEG